MTYENHSNTHSPAKNEVKNYIAEVKRCTHIVFDLKGFCGRGDSSNYVCNVIFKAEQNDNEHIKMTTVMISLKTMKNMLGMDLKVLEKRVILTLLKPDCDEDKLFTEISERRTPPFTNTNRPWSVAVDVPPGHRIYS